jgi:chaperone modulatory protein CbpM
MSESNPNLIRGQLLEEDAVLSLVELCRACGCPVEEVVQLVDEGVIEPRGAEPRRWRFQAVSIRRVQSARRLRRDLGVNLAGAALALELLDELDRLRRRLQRLEHGGP